VDIRKKGFSPCNRHRKKGRNPMKWTQEGGQESLKMDIRVFLSQRASDTI
jgi:hypothetical protein